MPQEHSMSEEPFTPPPVLLLENISHNQILEELQLADSPRPLQNSIRARHREEYKRIAESETLHNQGISITEDEAREIYEQSKIFIGGLAEREARYTPALNLVFLTRFGEELRLRGATREQAWDNLQNWRKSISEQVDYFGDRALSAYKVNPTIQEIFLENSTRQFLHAEFVSDFFDRMSLNDTRIVATRGKVEGELGQVYKVHTSGLLEQRAKGKRVDMVVYSNDAKAEALLSLTRLLPGVSRRHIIVSDDNPSEITPYLQVARQNGLTNIEVVQVSHPDAKRKGADIGLPPTVEYWAPGNTNLRHYSATLIGFS